MSSSRRLELGVAALVIATACGRPSRSLARDIPPDSPRPEAIVLDAGATAVSSTSPPDAPMQPTISSEDQEQLADALSGLHDEHPHRFDAATAWLVAHPDLARPPMIEIVDGFEGPGSSMKAKRAARVLGKIGHPDDVGPLARALDRGGELSAWDFALALAEHRDPAAFDALVTATGTDQRWAVRAATTALGVRREERGRVVLEGLLDHADADVRYKAVLALIELGATKSRPALKARKKVEDDEDVRGALRKALP